MNIQDIDIQRLENSVKRLAREARAAQGLNDPPIEELYAEVGRLFVEAFLLWLRRTS